MQEQPEANHENEQRSEGQNETRSAARRETVVEQEPRNNPKGGYFSKAENWVALLTLIFVGAYTVITFEAFVVSNRAFMYFDKAA
jgi:hypothetical protein